MKIGFFGGVFTKNACFIKFLTREFLLFFVFIFQQE